MSGAGLIVVLFLPWYGMKGTSATINAWEAFAVNDVILLVVALLAVGLWTATATQRTTAVPMAFASLTALLAILATLLVVVRLIFEPSVSSVATEPTALGVASYAAVPTSVTIEAGAWLGLAACLGILLGAFLAMRDERTPRTAAPTCSWPPSACPSS